jgi:hypothetical protein
VGSVFESDERRVIELSYLSIRTFLSSYLRRRTDVRARDADAAFDELEGRDGEVEDLVCCAENPSQSRVGLFPQNWGWANGISAYAGQRRLGCRRRRAWRAPI